MSIYLLYQAMAIRPGFKTWFMQSLSWVHQNRESERKALLEGWFLKSCTSTKRQHTQNGHVNTVEAPQSDHLRNSTKVVITRVGRLQKWAVLISDHMVKQERVVAFESFRNSLIILWVDVATQTVSGRWGYNLELLQIQLLQCTRSLLMNHQHSVQIN